MILASSNRSKLAGLLCLVLCALASPGFALPEDREQPIEIEADRAERNERDGTTFYLGNVVLTQGSLLIQAERLEIYNLGNQVDRVIGYGKPAYLEQVSEVDKPPVKARGNTLYYFVGEERIRLVDNASLEQDGSTVHSDIIDYLIKEEQASTAGEGRVKVVIPPQLDPGKDD